MPSDLLPYVDGNEGGIEYEETSMCVGEDPLVHKLHPSGSEGIVNNPKGIDEVRPCSYRIYVLPPPQVPIDSGYHVVGPAGGDPRSTGVD